MALDVLDDVFAHDLSLKAFERALQTLAINNLHLSQRNSPQFPKCYHRFSVAASVRCTYLARTTGRASNSGVSNPSEPIPWNRHGSAWRFSVDTELVPASRCESSYTTLAVLKNSGSNSRPIPGPDGTGITPFLISKFGVYHDSFFAGPRETYSIHGPIFGVVAAN